MIRFISTEPNSRRWDEFYTLDNGKVKHRYYTGTAFNVKILSKSKALSVINTLSDYMKLDTNDTPIPGPGLQLIRSIENNQKRLSQMYVSSSNFRFLIDDYSLILSLGPFSFATTNSISVDDCTFYGNTTITIGNRRFNIQSQEYISICQIGNTFKSHSKYTQRGQLKCSLPF